MKTNHTRIILAGLIPYAVYYTLASIVMPFLTLQLLTGYFTGMTLTDSLQKIDPKFLQISLLITGFGILSALFFRLIISRSNLTAAFRQKAKLGAYFLLVGLIVQYVAGFILLKYGMVNASTFLIIAYIVSGLLGIILFCLFSGTIMYTVLGETREAYDASKLFMFHFVPAIGVLLLFISLFIIYLSTSK